MKDDGKSQEPKTERMTVVGMKKIARFEVTFVGMTLNAMNLVEVERVEPISGRVNQEGTNVVNRAALTDALAALVEASEMKEVLPEAMV